MNLSEYFAATAEERAKLRGAIAQGFNSAPDIIEACIWGVEGQGQDCYDGAVNLVAEVRDAEILIEAAYLSANAIKEVVKEAQSLAFFASKMYLSIETPVEILIKAIACAYRINAKQRFEALEPFSLIDLPSVPNRTVKTSVIDALEIIFDYADNETRKNIAAELMKITSEQDSYVKSYATQALLGLIKLTEPIAPKQK
jgi:hypothetical protein